MDASGNTPLLLACQHGHTAVVHCLLLEEEHVSLHVKNVDWSALHVACGNGHLGLVKYLFDDREYGPSCNN